MSEEMKEVIISVRSRNEFGEGAGISFPIETTVAPIGSASPRNTKLVPHYLRASTGSCHDLCKFGIKHSSEVRTRRPVFPRRLNNNQKPSAARDEIETGNYGQKKEKKELGLKISQKKVQPTGGHKVIKQLDPPHEKIIQLSDSSTNLTKTYDQEPTNSNDETSDKNLPSYQEEESSDGSVSIKCVIPSSILEGNESAAQKSAIPFGELFDESMDLNSNSAPMGNIVDIGEIMDLVQGEDSYVETYAPSTRKNIESVEHAIDSVERLSDKTLSNRKLNTLVRSTNESTKTEENIDKIIASGKHKPSGYLGGARKPAFPRKSKTLIQRIKSPIMHKTPLRRAGGSFSEQSQMKILSTSNKSKKEVNKLKNGHKESGDIDRPEASKAEQANEVGLPNVMKKNVRGTLEESVKSKPGPELKKKLSTTRTAASVTPVVHKRPTLLANGAVDASTESVSSVKLKKVVLKSSHSSSLEGLTDRKNQHKGTYVVEQPKSGEDKVPEQLSTPPLIKPHHTRVSNLKLKNLKSLSPFLAVKNQTKFGRSKKTLHATEPMTEKVDLNAMKLKLRKRASHSSIRKEEHDGSTSKGNEVNKSTPPREVTRGSSMEFSSEFKLKHRRTPSNQSVERLSKTINFSRGKVIKPQPENNTPAWLRFRRTKAVADKLCTKAVVGRSNFRNKMEAGDTNLNNSSLETAAIVLRHTDVQDKKEVQGLLNNVIEETASKLVESRKSKVKALVGAFETVISLQESKTPVLVP